MKSVKSVCPYCKKVDEYTKKELVLIGLRNTFLGAMVAAGFLFLLYLYIVTPQVALDRIISGDFNRMAAQQDDEVRALMLDITKECHGDDPYCYARALYYNVSSMRYVSPGVFKKVHPPLYTYENGGDCKNGAYMYVAMLKSVGIYAEVVCSTEHRHCVSKVPFKYGGYVIVDLTAPKAVMMFSDDDPWNYLNVSTEWYMWTDADDWQCPCIW